MGAVIDDRAFAKHRGALERARGLTAARHVPGNSGPGRQLPVNPADGPPCTSLTPL
jgi:hypothetical protein